MQNEVGCYKQNSFSAGTYAIDYLFKIYPPLEYDERYCHLNLKLADEHLPYKTATVAIHDPNGFVYQIFPHSPMVVKQENGVWILTGTSNKDELLEVEMLLSPEVMNVMEGFPRYVEGIEEKTISANADDTNNVLVTLNWLLGGFILILPVILYLIYRRYGMEKSVVVPDTLSYVPQKRKPWIVNQIFSGDSFDLDENGFYATLLDLHRRKIIEIDSEVQETERLLGIKRVETSLKIKILDENQEKCDAYERRILNFLRQYGSGNVFSSDSFEFHLKNLRENLNSSELSRIREQMHRMMEVADTDVSREFVNESFCPHISVRLPWMGRRSVSFLFRN